MDAVGIMLMWLIGIIAFPIVAYVLWRFLGYVGKLPGKTQSLIFISILVVSLVLYVGTSHIVDKGYCFRDGKYFSEYSEEK